MWWNWKENAVDSVYDLINRRMNVKEAAETSRHAEVADRARKTAIQNAVLGYKLAGLERILKVRWDINKAKYVKLKRKGKRNEQ